MFSTPIIHNSLSPSLPAQNLHNSSWRIVFFPPRASTSPTIARIVFFLATLVWVFTFFPYFFCFVCNFAPIITASTDTVCAMTSEKRSPTLRLFIVLFLFLIDTARLVCKAGSIKRYGVCPSVCPVRQLQQPAAGLPLWEISIDCCTTSAAAARRSAANAGSATFAADVGS